MSRVSLAVKKNHQRTFAVEYVVYLRNSALVPLFGGSPLCGRCNSGVYPRIPIFFPTRCNTPSACCSTSFVCVAVMMVRIRALPSGTVGKAMPVPSTPSLNNSREKAMVKRPSPMMMGVIGVSLAGVVWPPMLKPSRPSSFIQKRVLAQSCSIHCGSVSRTSKAAMQVAATDGGCEVENRNGRARWQRKSIRSRVPQTYPPRAPIAFDKVPT